MEQGAQSQKATPTQGGMATIRYNVYSQPGPHAGKNIGTIRQELKGHWQIPDDAVAHKGKEPLADDYVVQPTDHIEFHRKMGEKGQFA